MYNNFDEIAQKFEQRVNYQLESLIDEYIKKFGNDIDVDSARDLCPEYWENPSFRPMLSSMIHESCSTIAKEVFASLLKDSSTSNENIVYFLAGGPGSGKSTVKQLIKKKIEQDRQLVNFIFYDSTFSNSGSAKKKIDQALSAGYSVVVAYIYRDPELATFGAVHRAVKTGRIVPINEIINLHSGAYETIFDLIKHYEQNASVMFWLMDNRKKICDSQYRPSLEDLLFENLDQLRNVTGILATQENQETLKNLIREKVEKGGTQAFLSLFELVVELKRSFFSD